MLNKYYDYQLSLLSKTSQMTSQPEKLPMDIICVPIDNNVVSTAKLGCQNSLGSHSTDDHSIYNSYGTTCILRDLSEHFMFGDNSLCSCCHGLTLLFSIHMINTILDKIK